MWTGGRRTKTNPKTSPELRTIFQLVREMNKTSVLTKFHDDLNRQKMKTAPPPGSHFHDDWAKNVTSRVKLPPPRQSCYSTEQNHFRTLLSYQGKNVMTKFHEHWAKIVTSRVFTCFHYIHIEKNAPPTGGHKNCLAHWRQCFQRTGTIFELNQHIIKTNILTNFELDRDFIGTKLLTKFHEDRTINMASRVFTNQMWTTDGRTDRRRTKDRSQKLTGALR
ncbi:hypothetical protein DPMN_012439 [Dreissena polymorpha]|uniref:Uncharacterized protein n=1 Tax=Dreissena polymorpha TaxID=45954 RepID=A0A9D4S1C9_DREPO|nr:hypothetical protein DPMN_012439 [Dreissena polymorpha]